MGNKTNAYIKNEVSKLKKLKAKYNCKITVAKLKAMEGFENITDDVATQIIEQIDEYATIVLKQLNRLQILKNKGYEE